MTGTKKTIAFQGELGANSHLACLSYGQKMEALPCATFEDVFERVQRNEAELAMIPIENTLAGRVAAIQHLLPESGLSIIDEHFEHIRFCLLGLPEAELKDLRYVYSHIMALGQCRDIIHKLNLIPIATSDTAGAAKEVAENKNKNQAALAPLGAAKIYGLKLFQENVEDDEHNITRFIVLRKKPLEIKKADIEKNNWITSFIFRVRNVPAALYKALGGFASHNVNMIRLESGQIEPPFSVTQFYADIEGHPAQANVIGAMEELTFFSDKVHMLGTYPSSAFRRG